MGGGFVIVPALTLLLKLSMPEAIGTSLLVIAINSAVALAARLATTSIDWARHRSPSPSPPSPA